MGTCVYSMRIIGLLHPFPRKTLKKYTIIQWQQIKSLSNEIPKSKKRRKGEETLVHVKGEILIGYHSIRMSLDNLKRKIHKIYYNIGSDGERMTEVVDLAKSQGID